MKKQHISISVFSILLFLGSSSIMIGQDQMHVVPYDEASKLITYQEVVNEEGNQQDLFNRCVGFLNAFYKNPVAVTRVRDPETGVIKGQHQFRIYYKDEDGYDKDGGMVMYDFKIEMKDGRYRYTVSDFVLKKTSRYPIEQWLDQSDPEYKEKWKSYLEQINAYMNERWIPTLKKSMKPLEVIEEEEW